MSSSLTVRVTVAVVNDPAVVAKPQPTLKGKDWEPTPCERSRTT
jgi:hypothetical protein